MAEAWSPALQARVAAWGPAAVCACLLPRYYEVTPALTGRRGCEARGRPCACGSAQGGGRAGAAQQHRGGAGGQRGANGRVAEAGRRAALLTLARLAGPAGATGQRRGCGRAAAAHGAPAAIHAPGTRAAAAAAAGWRGGRRSGRAACCRWSAAGRPVERGRH